MFSHNYWLDKETIIIKYGNKKGENKMDFQIILDFLSKWIPTALQIIGVFATIATLTPNKSDDRIVQFLLDLVNFLGGNIGKAKNSSN